MNPTAGSDDPRPATRTTLRLELDGLVAVHAARAAHTALGGVPGIVTADVTLAGAMVEIEGPYDAAHFAAAVGAALAPIGLSLRSVTMVQLRQLPLA
ncbi:MAG: hypothetical protein WCK74_08565 [Gemmatimonadaceae bacterium]|jgi:hypothetical protein